MKENPSLPEALIAELDAYLDHKKSEQANKKDQGNQEKDPTKFTNYIKELYGADIWKMLLSAISLDSRLEKYLFCIPAEESFLRRTDDKALPEPDILHPAVMKVLSEKIFRAVEEVFREPDTLPQGVYFKSYSDSYNQQVLFPKCASIGINALSDAHDRNLDEQMWRKREHPDYPFSVLQFGRVVNLIGARHNYRQFPFNVRIEISKQQGGHPYWYSIKCTFHDYTHAENRPALGEDQLGLEFYNIDKLIEFLVAIAQNSIRHAKENLESKLLWRKK